MVAIRDPDVIKTIPTAIPNNKKVIELISEIEKKCLDPVEKKENQDLMTRSNIQDKIGEQIKRPLELIATAQSTNQELLRQFSAAQANANKKSSKSFSKIPVQYQNMILVASSIGDITEVEINDEANAFFKCPNLLNASILLNSMLDSQRIDCSISNAMVTSLMHGSFLWTNPLTPSCLASSVITSEDLLRTDMLHEGMVLDLSTKFKISEVSLDKLTKTQELFPTSIENMIERLRALKALVDLFFRERSYAAQGLRALINRCIDNKIILRSRLSLDKDFIAKFLCAVEQ